MHISIVESHCGIRWTSTLCFGSTLKSERDRFSRVPSGGVLTTLVRQIANTNVGSSRFYYLIKSSTFSSINALLADWYLFSKPRAP